MAKKSKSSNQPHKSTAKSARTASYSSYDKEKSAKSRNFSGFIGCVVLLAFIFFEELWIGTAVCACGFLVFFVLQVFVDKSHSWYTSPYLYFSLIVAVLAYLEYAQSLISNLLGLK